MKKPGKKELWSELNQHQIFGKRLKRRRLKTNGRTIKGSALSRNQTGIRYDKEKKSFAVSLPQRTSFSENFEEVTIAMALIRKAAQGIIKMTNLDFSKMEYISPACALVIASEIDRWNEKVGKRLRPNIDTWHPNVADLLAQMGFFELLGKERPELKAKPIDTRFMPFVKGRRNVDDGGTLAKNFRIGIEELCSAKINKARLFEAVTEAITNVCHHAYPDASETDINDYWMSASFNSESKYLTITFFDQGVGIPKTLPSSRFFEKIRSIFGSLTDAEKIKAAIEIGRSSSNSPERGKGLNNLLEFAKAYPGGMMRIYSLNGCLKYSNGAKSEFELTDYDSTLSGTLIEWRIAV